MRKTSVDIDDDLMKRASSVLGTSSIKATIDAALREVLRSEARRQEIKALSRMEGLDLAKKDVMARAWRS